ncbi:MAG: hypothetical protein JO227_08025 [Acetobacteraceae bacterium]|nr:hypothetical protein [Acetobacteraceae bacterium]
MNDSSYRSLEQMCRQQAALTTHEETRRSLQQMADEFRRKADTQERPPDKE